MFSGGKPRKNWVWRLVAIGWWYTTSVLIDGKILSPNTLVKWEFEGKCVQLCFVITH